MKRLNDAASFVKGPFSAPSPRIRPKAPEASSLYMLVRGYGPGTVSHMSATTEPSTDNKEHRLRSYLRQRAADGEVYVKSKFIADDVGLSPKEIGALMVKLRESATDLDIEKWSYTSATTWRVARP